MNYDQKEENFPIPTRNYKEPHTKKEKCMQKFDGCFFKKGFSLGYNYVPANTVQSGFSFCFAFGIHPYCLAVLVWYARSNFSWYTSAFTLMWALTLTPCVCRRWKQRCVLVPLLPNTARPAGCSPVMCVRVLPKQSRILQMRASSTFLRLHTTTFNGYL